MKLRISAKMPMLHKNAQKTPIPKFHISDSGMIIADTKIERMIATSKPKLLNVLIICLFLYSNSQ